MASVQEAMLVLLAVAGLTLLGRRLPLPLPLTQVLGGIALAFLPGYPAVELEPAIFFFLFLPPLLYADAWLMPLRDLREALRPVLSLALGPVVLTTLAIGLVIHALVPAVPLAAAFALGAAISPTDAVATAAVLQKVRAPTRLSTLLNGESLLNDATGLVAFRFALAAALAGSFSLAEAAREFVALAAGGLLVGVAVSAAIDGTRSWLRDRQQTDPRTETTMSLLTPFAAYLAADGLGVSVVLAVVAAGLYAGYRDPVGISVQTRFTAWEVWSIVLYWLNGTVFVLLGLQFPALVDSVSDALPFDRVLALIGLVSLVTVLCRFAWVFGLGWLPRSFGRFACGDRAKDRWREELVVAWAGMRGAVTLAAALSLPDEGLGEIRGVPVRDLLVFTAFGVVLVTLLLHGATLEWLLRRLRLADDGRQQREDRLARFAAVRAGLRRLREVAPTLEDGPDRAALAHVESEYTQRLAEIDTSLRPSGSAGLRLAALRRFRLEALEAERSTLDRLWQRGTINDETHRPLQRLLDLEEERLRSEPTS